MPGFGADQPYLPYYELGVARQNLKDCPGALKAWESAEQAGAVTKAKEYSDLQKRRGQCGGK